MAGPKRWQSARDIGRYIRLDHDDQAAGMSARISTE